MLSLSPKKKKKYNFLLLNDFPITTSIRARRINACNTVTPSHILAVRSHRILIPGPLNWVGLFSARMNSDKKSISIHYVSSSLTIIEPERSHVNFYTFPIPLWATNCFCSSDLMKKRSQISIYQICFVQIQSKTFFFNWIIGVLVRKRCFERRKTRLFSFSLVFFFQFFTMFKSTQIKCMYVFSIRYFSVLCENCVCDDNFPALF